jgi:tetratricopeptide (TPR) repeat protein
MANVSLRAYNREIEAMIERGQLEEAVAHCQHILKTFPKHLETYRLLGKAYLEAKNNNEAVDIFSRVLVSEPNDFVAQVGMSIIRDEQNKLDDAIWHMERAFEVQSANPAIQGELQRLYGRRDGAQPPRIRMTRGALAHMYMRGELYPQAISEAKSVLQEDPGRSDMQVLLARAYYKSGQKKDAADAASAVLKRYPYCFDANRVLTEILGSDRPESAQAYRRHVVELDPYAAQVNGTVFQADEVGDPAVSLDHLDWNGQPVGMPAGWGTTGAIGLNTGSLGQDEQPEWLRNSLPATTTPQPSQTAGLGQGALAPAQPADDIPDFLRNAGWGESTGAFDESTASAMFDDAPAAPAQPVAAGDLPDWVKAMKPPQQEDAQPAEDEEIPDWINKIGTGALQLPTEESLSSDDQSDWLSGLGGESDSQTETSGGELDWMNDLAQGEQTASAVSDSVSLDWLKDMGQDEQPASTTVSDEQPDWMKDLGGEEPVSSEEEADGLDFLNKLTSESQPEPEQQAPAEQLQAEVPMEPVSQPSDDADNLGKGEQDIDDALAWFESLAAKQGATEGLLTKPEERREDEPDWVKQAKGLTEEKPKTPAPQAPVKEPEPVAPQPAANVDDLGKSEQDVDDALAWFESLAAKQGATEGLLTKPEERREQEPEWVKQAKESGTKQPPDQQTPVEEPEPEIETPMPPPPPVAYEPEELVPADDVSSWLAGLDKEEEAQEPAPVAEDDTASWLRSLDEPEEESPVPSEPVADDLPAWMQDVSEEEVSVAEPVAPMEGAQPVIESPAPVDESGDVPSWLGDLEKEEEQAVSASDELPAWMRDETGEVVAEPTKIEPTSPADWKPVEAKKEEKPAPPPPAPEPVSQPSFVSAQNKPEPAPKAEPKKKPAPRKKTEVKPATPPEPYKEPVTRRVTGMLTMPVDPILGSARSELSRSNIPGALETYEKLIKKGRFLEEVIYDLREALYRYPVEVSIWQTLGDAYMRANQLQDALDAYTKAEELLR